MSTLFLIGNGFDINCGMRTRFSDVCKEYVASKSDSALIQKFKRDIQSDIENWSDFEMAMAEYASTLPDGDTFVECVRDFSFFMEEYLKKESLQFKNLLSNRRVYEGVNKEFIYSVGHYYDNSTPNIKNVMIGRMAGSIKELRAISFNYTDVFDVILSSVLNDIGIASRREVVHINGKLDDGPALGVDNESQLKVKYDLSISLKREFIKPFFNQEYDAERINKAKEYFRVSNTICSF